MGLAPFHALWRRGLTLGVDAPLGQYSVNAMAAAQGRITKHANGTGSGAYAFHFDAGLYARMLRDLAEKGGVSRHEGMIAGVERAPDSGDVTALMLTDGRRIAGDLFVDCSGFASLLLGKALGVPYESWAHWLPCDRAIAVQSANIAPPDPFTRSTAHGAGWQWRIPCATAPAMAMCFPARIWMRTRPPPSSWPTWRARRSRSRGSSGSKPGGGDAWSHNVVALGLAAGFLEPLESTSIHLVQSGVERLVRFLPGAVIHDAERAAFNAQTRAEWENVRDFIIAHYAVNRRDEPFWRACAAMPLPDSLRQRLDLFAASGRLLRSSEELFAEVGWLQVLVGQGMISGDWNPMANAPDPAGLTSILGQQRAQVERAVAAMPSHADYLTRHCAARESVRG
jgi:tryptophan halogenase